MAFTQRNMAAGDDKKKKKDSDLQSGETRVKSNYKSLYDQGGIDSGSIRKMNPSDTISGAYSKPGFRIDLSRSMTSTKSGGAATMAQPAYIKKPAAKTVVVKKTPVVTKKVEKITPIVKEEKLVLKTKPAQELLTKKNELKIEDKKKKPVKQDLRGLKQSTKGSTSLKSTTMGKLALATTGQQSFRRAAGILAEKASTRMGGDYRAGKDTKRTPVTGKGSKSYIKKEKEKANDKFLKKIDRKRN